MIRRVASGQCFGGQRSARMSSTALFPSLGVFEHVLTVMGLLTVSKFLLQLLWTIGNGVRVHFWSRLWRKRLVEDYGSWAGGSSAVPLVKRCAVGYRKHYQFCESFVLMAACDKIVRHLLLLVVICVFGRVRSLNYLAY